MPAPRTAETATQAGSTGEGGALPSARYIAPDGTVNIARDDQDALTGHFAKVIAGEYEGRIVVVGPTIARNKDGFPKTVTARTRDSRDEDIVVDYVDLRPAESGGR